MPGNNLCSTGVTSGARYVNLLAVLCTRQTAVNFLEYFQKETRTEMHPGWSEGNLRACAAFPLFFSLCESHGPLQVRYHSECTLTECVLYAARWNVMECSWSYGVLVACLLCSTDSLNHEGKGKKPRVMRLVSTPCCWTAVGGKLNTRNVHLKVQFVKFTSTVCIIT